MLLQTKYTICCCKKDLLPYIDWNPFFAVWQLRGTYPTRNYPRIFEDAKVGEQAQKLFNEAQQMLNEIIENKWLRANGIIGFYPANSVDEDLELYEDEARTNKVATLFGLRQQSEKVNFATCHEVTQ